jgi:hypothetical protein
MNISDAVVPKHHRKPGKEPSEVVRIQVPALVPQELFDRVQAKLAHTSGRYKQPAVYSHFRARPNGARSKKFLMYTGVHGVAHLHRRTHTCLLRKSRCAVDVLSF